MLEIKSVNFKTSTIFDQLETLRLRRNFFQYIFFESKDELYLYLKLVQVSNEESEISENMIWKISWLFSDLLLQLSSLFLWEKNRLKMNSYWTWRQEIHSQNLSKENNVQVVFIFQLHKSFFNKLPTKKKWTYSFSLIWSMSIDKYIFTTKIQFYKVVPGFSHHNGTIFKFVPK